MDIPNLPELHEVLGRLPWFRDLSRGHRSDMLAEIVERLVENSSRDDFAELLVHWSDIAYSDVKWARLKMLRQSGLLEPPQAA